jgi:DnaJ-class molecular chaperone
MRNYYYVLGVDPKATKSEIKAKHDHLIMNETDKEVLQRINKAYEVLSDNKNRKKYDEFIKGKEYEEVIEFKPSNDFAELKKKIENNIASTTQTDITGNVFTPSQDGFNVIFKDFDKIFKDYGNNTYTGANIPPILNNIANAFNTPESKPEREDNVESEVTQPTDNISNKVVKNNLTLDLFSLTNGYIDINRKYPTKVLNINLDELSKEMVFNYDRKYKESIYRESSTGYIVKRVRYPNSVHRRSKKVLVKV